MLVPMLSLIGIFEMGTTGLQLSWLSEWLGRLSDNSQLVLILSIFVVILSGQAWLQRMQTIRNTRIQQQFIRTLRQETYRAIIMAKWSFSPKRKSDFNHILTTELARVSQGTNLILQMAASLILQRFRLGSLLAIREVNCDCTRLWTSAVLRAQEVRAAGQADR